MKEIRIPTSDIETIEVINTTEVEVFFKGGGSCILSCKNPEESARKLNEVEELVFMPLMY